ncbi:MAG: phosphate acetyltransferase [Clostridia bacterium]|nr:phosphate acetyltransferase [Clostridia bacterium]MBQ2914179.1 phosphate acetyltransferase [Clostridia bacterium]MBQ4272599.1 phosphate acetyltransferase [Clostridia bacterium]
MNILEQIKQKAAQLQKTIVLCEGEDSRVVKAAQDATREGIAKIVLIGDEDAIKAANPDVDLTGVTIVNNLTSERLPEYIAKLCELRKSKGMTEEQASALLKDGTYFGAMMLKMGEVDGLVSGACHSTANTLRPGLQIIKTAPGAKAVTSFNLMLCPPQGNQYCPDGLVVFADCGLNPTYTSEGLADLAISTAKSAKAIAGIDPKVAMLSFSSKGSAKHDNVSMVAEATRIAQETAPELKIDGELQFDAAIVPSVGEMKAKGSPVAGHANVFVFPDLQSGNIGYKIAERLGGFMAVGPICQGFAKPMNDLSRGCKTEDIVACVAITALQTQF